MAAGRGAGEDAAAAAAMVFSTLCRPRMGISAAGISGAPSSSTMPSSSQRRATPARRLLNQTGVAAGARGVGDAGGVVGVQHGEIAGLLGLEEAALGGGVVLEGVVAVEVVRRDVERHADVGAERLDGLELEARKLEHVPLRPGAESSTIAVTGRADIAAHLDRDAALPQDVADHGGGGGLAVGAGDADGAAPAGTARPVRLRR